MEPGESVTREHPRKEELEQLRKELQSHPGTTAYYLLQEIKRAFDVWFKKSIELYTLLQFGETDDNMQTELMRNVGDRSAKIAYMARLDEVMPAYTNALSTLVDITRRVMGHDLGTELYAEWERRSGEVRKVQCASFIRQLRNFLSHYASPPINLRGEIKPDSMTTEILLDPATLRSYDSWNAESQALIDANPDGVRLSAIMPGYHAAMAEFYVWLINAYGDQHASKFDARNELVSKYNLALTDGVSDGRDMQDRMAHMQENLAARREGRPETDFEDWVRSNQQETPPNSTS